jgi:hypothetical protein
MAQMQYVYVYRDSAQRVVYVGRGERLARAEAHIDGTHNPGLSAIIVSDASRSKRPDHTETRPLRGQ